jgi:16S rRNA (uracil1498-N3)-methyltransferase
VHHAPLPEERDAIVRLDSHESHHVRRVLRLREGDVLSVFDGAGREWSAVIEGVAEGRVELRLASPLEGEVEPEVDVALYQAVCRSQRMEWVIQKAVELGVAAIHPVPAERAEARPPSASRLDRWRRIALEACKQCGRRRCPAVVPVDAPPAAEPGVLPLLLDPDDKAAPLGDVLNGAQVRRVWLAVGPESGFSDGERGRFRDLGWQACGLGPRTLRTETAGIAAAAIVLHRLGDLGRGSKSG